MDVLLDNVPFRSEQAAALRICFSKCCAEPCAGLLQLVQLVIIQHSHFTRMTTYDFQMFNNSNMPVVEHLCMTSIIFLPPTSSVQQQFGVRLLWLPMHLALPVQAVVAAAMATIGKVGLAMDVDSSDTTERDGAATTAAGGDDDDNGRAPRRRFGLSGVRAERGGGARGATSA